MHELLEHAMRGLPSQGRGSGWVSRRNRALLVLTELAGLSGADITTLTAGDVTVIDGAAIISTARGPITVDSVEDNVLCGPCALVRWLRTLEMAAIYPDQRVPTAVITRGAPLAADSPHACRGGNPVNPRIRHAPLLPVIDQWDWYPPGGTTTAPPPHTPRNTAKAQTHTPPDTTVRAGTRWPRNWNASPCCCWGRRHPRPVTNRT